MPRVAGFRISAIDDLYRQLRYAPRERRLRQMAAAERLIDDLDLHRIYPREFVVYRITGYRPDRGDEPVTFPGETLISDLATMVQRLSDSLDLPLDHAGRRAVAIEEAAHRLNVSSKTLQRYRRLGLVCHYILFPDGVKRLGCFDDALNRFTARHRSRIERAAAFSRLSEDAEEQIIMEARRLREELHCSLNQAARRLSRRHGRAQETVRTLLRRHDEESDAGDRIFREHGPLTERDGDLIERAWRFGVSMRALSEHFGKTTVSIRRALHRRQHQRLCALPLQWVHLPTFDRSDAGAVITGAPAVRSDLDALLPTDDALALIRAARCPRVEGEDVEHALAAGYHFLKRRARTRLEAESRAWPGAQRIDEVQTDLRWATRLKRRLVTIALPPALARLEQNLQRPVETMPSDRIISLVTLARSVASDVVESIDPARQKLSRVTAYSMERALARANLPPVPESRAAARHAPGAVSLGRFYAGLTPWEDLVELRRDLVPLIGQLDEFSGRLVRSYYGLTGTRPQSCAGLAEMEDRTPAMIARRLRRAEIALLALARRSSGSC